MKAIGRGPECGEFIFTSAEGKLVGWVRRDLEAGMLDDFMRDPDAFFNDPSARVLKNGIKTKVIQKAVKGPPFEVIIKRFYYGSLPRRWGFLIGRSPAVRSLQGALLLARSGFDTPGPLAAFEFRSWERLGTSYYITEEAKDSISLRTLWRLVFPTLARSERLALTNPLLRDLARLLFRLHSAGIYHRDLKGANILIQGWESARRRFLLVDLDRVEKRSRFPLSKRIKNLLQVRRGVWSLKEKIYFFMRYAGLFSASKKERKALVRKILALSRRRNRSI